MASKVSFSSEIDDISIHDTESGYASGSSSGESLPEITFTKAHLAFLNRQLQFLEPQGMQLRFAFSFIERLTFSPQKS